MDIAKAGRYLGCYSRELVIMGPCRHSRDWSAASVPQRCGHILKNGLRTDLTRHRERFGHKPGLPIIQPPVRRLGL
ncbi:MAG: hypothetical protein DMG72_07120 [Acidobacteria bacterium]|nr:MAG: hypothetical protein DMG72_07120 [Acidobacteriota bacterium]